MNVNSEELSPIPDSWLNDWEWFDESALPVNSELLEALGKIETGLYQISLGTHGFEEATTYSKYASEKAKGLRKILKAAIQKEKPNNEK